MRPVFYLFLSLASFNAFAGNYATCLIQHMPDLNNDSAAYAAGRLCIKEHPGGLQAVEQGSGRSFFAYKSGAECTLKKGGETRSQVAGQMIFVACNRLYDEPPKFDPTTARPE